MPHLPAVPAVNIRNAYIVLGDTVHILLQRRNGDVKVARVSTHTFYRRVAPIATTWVFTQTQGGNQYVFSKDYRDRPKGQSGGGKTVYLHRVASGLQDGDARVADHLDCDGLNCTDANLRLVTAAENLARRRLSSRPNPSNTTGVRNVYRSGRKYAVTVAGRYLGTFNTIAAAEAAAKKERTRVNTERMMAVQATPARRAA